MWRKSLMALMSFTIFSQCSTTWTTLSSSSVTCQLLEPTWELSNNRLKSSRFARYWFYNNPVSFICVALACLWQTNLTLVSLGHLPPIHGEQQYKVEVYQQQIDMEKLCHQGELLLKKVSDQTDRDMIQEPLTELRHLWENLGDKITQRQVLLVLK